MTPDEIAVIRDSHQPHAASFDFGRGRHQVCREDSEEWPCRSALLIAHINAISEMIRATMESGNYLQVYDNRKNRWLSPDEAVMALVGDEPS